eukprot:evm.model.scf_1916.1 EVM.evm.TU.scf_1916.1   scf_1916:21189-25367(-)
MSGRWGRAPVDKRLEVFGSQCQGAAQVGRAARWSGSWPASALDGTPVGGAGLDLGQPSGGFRRPLHNMAAWPRDEWLSSANVREGHPMCNPTEIIKGMNDWPLEPDQHVLQFKDNLHTARHLAFNRELVGCMGAVNAAHGSEIFQSDAAPTKTRVTRLHVDVNSFQRQPKVDSFHPFGFLATRDNFGTQQDDMLPNSMPVVNRICGPGNGCPEQGLTKTHVFKN